MTNYVQPQACKILSVNRETDTEYTFRIATDMKPQHGQFLELSVPQIGECPISVSEQDDGWLECTIRKVGKVTDVIFQKKAGDILFLRGPYGRGWPVDELEEKHVFIIAGGTGVSPVRSTLNFLAENPDYARSVNLVCGFKNYESVLFKNELESWKEKFDDTWYCLDNEEHEGFRKGLVTTVINELPFGGVDEEYVVLVVGPPIMMKFVGLELLKRGIDESKIWMSFERKMSCAIGKCGHCRIDEVYICLDGPVFPYTIAKDLVD